MRIARCDRVDFASTARLEATAQERDGGRGQEQRKRPPLDQPVAFWIEEACLLI